MAERSFDRPKHGFRECSLTVSSRIDPRVVRVIGGDDLGVNLDSSDFDEEDVDVLVELIYAPDRTAEATIGSQRFSFSEISVNE